MTDESGFRIGKTAFKIVKVFLNSILKNISLTGNIYRAVLAKLLIYTFLPVNEKTCISIFKNTITEPFFEFVLYWTMLKTTISLK